MSQPNFFRLMLITFGLLLLAYQGLTVLFPNLGLFQDLFFISQFFYALLAIISFLVSKNLVKHPNPNVYSQWILLFVLTKILFSVSIFAAYKVLKKPSSDLFIIPFFINYAAYTIFCVYFMVKIGRENDK
jgi:hypothetical protein